MNKIITPGFTAKSEDADGPPMSKATLFVLDTKYFATTEFLEVDRLLSDMTRCESLIEAGEGSKARKLADSITQRGLALVAPLCEIRAALRTCQQITLARIAAEIERLQGLESEIGDWTPEQPSGAFLNKCCTALGELDAAGLPSPDHEVIELPADAAEKSLLAQAASAGSTRAFFETAREILQPVD